MSQRSEHLGRGGLQAERTVLAWSRTVLAVAATAALIARTAESGYERWAAVPLAAGGLVLVVVTAWRRRRSIALKDTVAAPAGWTVGGLVAGLAALLAAGLVVIL